MREIKFRGIHNYDSHWIYGNLTIQDDECFIYPQKSEEGMNSRDAYEVDPSTIGQLVGLKDKNRKDIFEGDWIENGHGNRKEVRIGNYRLTAFSNHDLTASYKHYGVHGYSEAYDSKISTGVIHWPSDTVLIDDTYKITGNIHENSELIVK